jgi:MtrB/PioB family decaheme-associated outer membrane protein
MKKKFFGVIFMAVLTALLHSQSARAATSTKLYKIRLGKHRGFTRLVFDTDGSRPLRIGPATADEVTVVYENLNFAAPPDRLFRDLRGAVTRVSHRRQDGQSLITITFRRPDTRVKTFYMPAEPPRKGLYRLVLDFYPEGSPLAGPGTQVPVKIAEAQQPALVPTPAPVEKPAPAVKEAPPPTKPQVAAEAEVPEKEEAEPAEVPAETPSTAETFLGNLSGEISLTGRPYISGDDESSKFDEYGEYNRVTGGWDVKYEEKDRYSFESMADSIGQDDQYVDLTGNWYGTGKFGISYDKIPHRFAFDAETLYSGVGSDTLTLDDTLQTDLQGLAGDPVAQANRLNAEFAADGSKGDPEFDRKKLKVNFDWVAQDPFSFRAEFSRERQDGTRPIFGSFGLDNAVEIFEPVDSQTLSMKFIAEYAKNPYHLNATYYYQKFENNEDTLTFDNPFRITDAIGASATGRADLAPDNYYHNLSLSGSYTALPLNSRISANAALGWMRQDDNFTAFTTNSALSSPPFAIDYFDKANLPAQNADAKVNTYLYNVMLSSKPLDYMRLKGQFRYYEYDNKTDTIIFPDGYVNSDSIPALADAITGNPIQNLPSSYKKMRGSADVGFDVWQKTRFNLDYKYNRTERTNREVDNQQDHIFGGSVDTRPASWLDMRASYERTFRDIDNYDYQVYFQSGQDLQQLPGIRKYDEADLFRDRLQFQANVYPIDPLAFSGSFTYGKDDFDDSAFGLLEDRHYIFSLDADYSVGDRLRLNAFYNYEKYDNEQKAQGEFDGGPVTSWTAKGEDQINTVGGGIKFALIPGRLDFESSYSYSKVDGKIDFSVPGGGVVDFDTVDETELHSLNSKLKYNIGRGFFLTLGYLYEKFDYEDYNLYGFTTVPTDGAGAFNGAILAGTLPQDYDVHIVYTQLTYKFDFDSD